MLPKTSLIHCQDADYLVFDTNDAITRHLRERGTWEPHLAFISQMFAQVVDAPLILDIGANIGAYAIPLAKQIAARHGVIYAYEPQRVVYYQLCGNLFLNRLDNVYAHCMAIGDTDGTIALPPIDYEKTNNIGGFSLLDDIRNQTNYVVLQNTGTAVDTPIRRMDSLTLPKAPSLIKIDVEGFDLKVLGGGVKLLEQSQFPPLLFEAWNFAWFADEKHKLLDFLHQLGYETTSIFADDYVAQHPNHPSHFDFITDGKGAFNMKRAR